MNTLNGTQKPKLIVFDLDYTLWPFWVDTHVDPPFTKKGSDLVVDSSNRTIKYYPEVPRVLSHLQSEGYDIAVASRTSEIQGANQLLSLFDWDPFFKYKEIYPGCKVSHFKEFKKKSKIEFRDMLFFDDESRNIRDIANLGACAVLVSKGVNMKTVEDGILQFASNYKNYTTSS